MILTEQAAWDKMFGVSSIIYGLKSIISKASQIPSCSCNIRGQCFGKIKQVIFQSRF